MRAPPLNSSSQLTRAARQDGEGGSRDLLAPGILITALTVGALAQGGKRLWPAVFMAVLLAAAVLVFLAQRRAIGGVVPRRVAVTAGLLALWGLLRGSGTDMRTSGVGYALVLAGALAVLVVVEHLTREKREWFVWALLFVGAMVATSGWLGVALRFPPWGHLDSGIWRAATPMTYENAAAGLLVPLSLLALGASIAAAQAQRRAFRIIAVVLLIGAGATLSRGGLVALAAGLLALAVMLGRSAGAATPPLVGAGVGVVALLPSLPASQAAMPLLALLGLAAGLLIAHISPRRASVLGAAGILIIGVVAALTRDRWLSLTGARLSLSHHRAEQFRAAWQEWLGNPLIGVGPGQARLGWEGADGEALTARYVHNEYLQLLLELGLVGLILFVLLGLGLLRQLRIAARDNGLSGVNAGATAGVIAFLVHSTTDFLWHVPVVPLSAAALLAVAKRRKEQQ